MASSMEGRLASESFVSCFSCLFVFFVAVPFQFEDLHRLRFYPWGEIGRYLNQWPRAITNARQLRTPRVTPSSSTPRIAIVRWPSSRRMR